MIDLLATTAHRALQPLSAFFGYSGAGGGSSIYLTPASITPYATGAVSLVQEFGISGTITYSKVSGDANVSVASDGTVSVAAGVAPGSTNVFRVRAQNTTGAAIEREVTMTATGVLIPVPIGYNYSPAYTFYNTAAGAYATNFDITTIKPAITTTYYVDPINGVDAAAGTRLAPLKSLSVALAKADVDGVIIINLVADLVVRSTVGWNGTNVARSVSVINETPQYHYVTAFASGTLPTFTLNGTYSDVYQSTTTAPAKMVDINSKTQPVNPRTGASITTVPPMFLTMTNVASILAVHNTAGTWYHDGTILYVHLFDGRTAIGDTKLIKTLAGNNGRAGGTDATTVYVENIDFVGGSPFNFSTASAGLTGTFAHKNCTFQACSSGQNGISVKGKITAYGYRSGAYNNDQDGFNYHSFQADGTTQGTSPTFFENECVSQGNGTTGATPGSLNASTSHDYALGIRLNCVYPNSEDRVVADTNFAQTWNMAVTAGQAIQQAPAKETFAVLVSANMWLDGCDAVTGTGTNPNFIAANSAILKYHNMTGVTNAGTAEATGTVVAY